jgi:hypothetical protein
LLTGCIELVWTKILFCLKKKYYNISGSYQKYYIKRFIFIKNAKKSNVEIVKNSRIFWDQFFLFDILYNIKTFNILVKKIEKKDVVSSGDQNTSWNNFINYYCKVKFWWVLDSRYLFLLKFVWDPLQMMRGGKLVIAQNSYMVTTYQIKNSNPIWRSKCAISSCTLLHA